MPAQRSHPTGWRRAAERSRVPQKEHCDAALAHLVPVPCTWSWSVCASRPPRSRRPTAAPSPAPSTTARARVVPGATVKAVHVATNFERTVTTSAEGAYTIPQLPVGAYVVIVTANGFQTTTLENIELTAGARVRVDGTLARRRPAGRRHGVGRRAADPDRQRQGDDGDQQQVHPGSAARRRRPAALAARPQPDRAGSQDRQQRRRRAAATSSSAAARKAAGT